MYFNVGVTKIAMRSSNGQSAAPQLANFPASSRASTGKLVVTLVKVAHETDIVPQNISLSLSEAGTLKGVYKRDTTRMCAVCVVE